MKLLLTFLVAFLGGYMGIRYRIPAGALVGSMIAVAVFNVAFESAFMPVQLKMYTQIATGTYLGAKISKTDLINLKQLLKPAVILCCVMVAFTLMVGFLICAVSDLSVPTALFSMAPAGISDMTLASMDFEDSDPAVVALIQTLRIIFTICTLPPLIKWIDSRRTEHLSAIGTAAEKAAPDATWKNLLLTLAVGLLTGAAGKWLGIPGGAITFAMLGCAAFHISTGRGYMPLRLRQFIQLFAGALIGCTVGRAEIWQIVELWDVVILAVVSFILLDVIAAMIIAKFTDMDLITALFSCAPGGLTDMALIAEDMGSDGLKVTGMHTIRLIGVVATYPAIIALVVRLNLAV